MPCENSCGRFVLWLKTPDRPSAELMRPDTSVLTIRSIPFVPPTALM